MPGKIADVYDRLSDIPTLRFGKPGPDHFIDAIELAVQNGASIPDESNRPRVLHIGDSIHHDIQGATSAGIDSLLVTEYGVHKEKLAGSKSLLHDVCDLCDEATISRPTYVLDTAKW